MDRAALNQLMTRAARGDRSVLQQVCRELWPIVYGLCLKMVGPNQADDMTQKALIKLFEAATSFDAEGDVTAWAMTIAAWECRTLRRRTRHSVSPDETLPSGIPSPEDEVSQRELLQHATEILASLTASDRDTLSIAFSDDPSAALASVAFRKRKQRALERLRALWRSSRHA